MFIPDNAIATIKSRSCFDMLGTNGLCGAPGEQPVRPEQHAQRACRRKYCLPTAGLRFKSTIVRTVALIASVALLAGCAVEPASQAMLDAYRVIRSESGVAEHHELNPKLTYLRVQVGDREVFMVLGNIDPTPEGQVEVWYSAEADVLRLLDGRVAGVIMKTGPNWLNVSFLNLPRWDAVANQAVFDRVRDVSPGYRYGIREKMLLRAISPPDDSQLKVVSPSSLAWFEESVQGSDARPARYAVNNEHRVVYAEQCLSSDYCFSWQRWPSTKKDAH